MKKKEEEKTKQEKKEREEATLSAAEQKLLSFLKKDIVVTFQTLKEVWKIKKLGSMMYLPIVIHSLVKKGYLLAIKKGTYHVTMGEPYDSILIGQFLYKGYIGFSTALWLYGLKTEMPTVCYVVVKKGKKEKKIGQMRYKSISLGERAVGAHYLNRYYVSTRAKTIFDCLYLPKYAGGYSQIIYAIRTASLTEQEWDEIRDYLIRLGTTSTLQRTGYLLSVMKEKYPDSIQERVLQKLLKRIKNELEKRKKTVVVLDPLFSKGGEFIKEWRIYDNVGKDKL